MQHNNQAKQVDDSFMDFMSFPCFTFVCANAGGMSAGGRAELPADTPVQSH
jgi:hypothetical protein